MHGGGTITMAAEIEIEINGKVLQAKPNQTVIQVADANGIYIPRFCYHKHLSVPANCRMCLVEIEKAPKTLPACATVVMPGMKVFTKSEKTIAAQRAVMEFLLINHPLDCPICDQGGECELQDLSMGYGSSHSHYDECKRSIADENLGPLIATDMTRCISCTRCVRFGDEIAGMAELGQLNRGEDVEISTYIRHAMQSEVSGNIIDLCPVGALTSKPYRFTARAWELDQKPSISPHDCLGSNVNVHTRYGKVMRVVSRENNAINQTWLSDRDRFSYTGLYQAERIQHPMVREHGEWREVPWERAFTVATTLLQQTLHEHGVEQLAALASPSSTLEEFYLLQKIIRGLGGNNIDYRLRESDTRDQIPFPHFAKPIADIDQCDAIVVIGSNLQKELPLLSLRVRRAGLKDPNAKIIVINPVDYPFNFKVSEKIIVAPHQMVDVLQQKSSAIAQQLQDKKNICIILGLLALHHPEAATIRYLAQQLAQSTGASVNIITDGANSAGGWLAGAYSIDGLNAYAMWQQPRKSYLLLNIEPDYDVANSAQAIAALKQAQAVIALSLYRNPVLDKHAHVILPIAPFTETSGTFVNADGKWQSFHGTAKAYGSSRPAWKILRVLANFLHLEGFGYESSEEVKHEVKTLVEHAKPTPTTSFAEVVKSKNNTGLSRIGEIPIYAIDSLVRHARPLQVAQTIMEGDVAHARLHSETAKHWSLQDGSKIRVKQINEIELPVIIDDLIAKDAIWIAGGIAETKLLGDLEGEVEIATV